MMQRTVRAALAITVLVAVPAAPASAQRAPAFAGAELRAGIVLPEQAVAGAGVMGEVDLGYLWRPELRVIAGLSHFRANIDREPGDDEGSFGATGIWLSGRYDLFVRQTTGAYVRAGLTLHSVSADAWDSSVDALLSGTNVGASIAAGARRNLDTAGRISGTLEVRRTSLNNIANTAVEIGVRMLMRGAAVYTPEIVAQTPARPLYDPTPAERATPDPVEQTPAGTDTTARRMAAERRADIEAAAAARTAELTAQQARDATLEARRAEEAAADRAAAAEALLRQGLTRSAAAMGSVSGMRETPAAFIVTLSGTAFPSGAGTLSAAARGELRVLATVLAGYPGHIVSVEGHTDAVGNAAANQALSLERANAVRAALIVEGVDPLWTGVRGFGAARPVASNDTAAGRAANRRVEIHVMRQPCAVPPRPGTDGGPVCPPGGLR
ncbi:MAG: OmpA family protein [Gemmatimonadetes bacterium]|nr:OmpA family protein [Gemmatimonadota bacterium]